MDKLAYSRMAENLANISMMAGYMMADGKIDPQYGHTELVAALIDLANRFDEEIGSKVDYNAPPDFDDLRDYWIEIDEFAERELLLKYGTERGPVVIGGLDSTTLD